MAVEICGNYEFLLLLCRSCFVEYKYDDNNSQYYPTAVVLIVYEVRVMAFTDFFVGKHKFEGALGCGAAGRRPSKHPSP